MNKVIIRLSLFGLVLASAVAQSALRDPTQPPAFISESIASGQLAGDQLKLQSIVIGKNRKHAVINNMIVKLGDWIEGRKLVAINLNSVRLQKEEDVFIDLELVRYAVKK